MKQFFKNNRQNNSLILKFLEIVLFCFSLLLDFKITSSSWRKKIQSYKNKNTIRSKNYNKPKKNKKKKSYTYIYKKLKIEIDMK
jgi:hypothetical protein